MKKLITVISAVAWLTSNLIFAQSNTVFTNDPHDLEGMETHGNENSWTPHGGVWTPKGDLKVLVIFAGFENDGENGWNNPSSEIWPNDHGSFENEGLPTYVNPETGDMSEFIFSNPNDFTSVIEQNPQNSSISRYYHDMSMGKFRFMAEPFRDPYTQKPVRVNIDRNDVGAGQWAKCNQLAIQKILEMYPDYDFSNYLSQFDNRENYPSYGFDNSTSQPDNKIDYVIFIWRYNDYWSSKPIVNMGKWHGSQGGFTGGAPNLEIGDHNFHGSFTLTWGVRSIIAVQESCIHEMAHMVFSCPHVMGANDCGGDRWHFSSGGWGMIKGAEFMNSINGWERWLLGWTELKSNEENTNILSADSLNSDGIYTIGDFITTGDVIRIKIPQVEDTYLWIENHQKLGVWEKKLFEGEDLSQWGDIVPGAEKGIYMYIDNTKRTRTSTNSTGIGVNGLKVLSAQGNFDYERSNIATKDWSNYYNNTLFTFERGEENPISGISPFYKYPDNYPNNPTVPIYEDEVIENTNSPNTGDNEAYHIIKETDGINTRLTFAHSAGLNYASKELFNRRSDAFQTGDKVGLSGIVPILNFPSYNKQTNTINPYILNGLSVEILSFNESNHTYQIKIKYDDYEINASKRWAGNLELRNTTLDDNPDIVVKNGNTLTINKSGVPNRHTKTALNDYINPTQLVCTDGSYFQQETNSTVFVQDDSKLILKSGSMYEVADGATLHIKDNAQFVMEPCSKLIIRGSGKIIFNVDTYMNIAEGAVLAFENTFENIEYTESRVINLGVLPGNILPPSYTINEYVLWNNKSFQLSLPVIIERDGVLEIKTNTPGKKHVFHNSKIIVKPGGKLIIDGAKLTNACPGLWQGIELHGNKNLSQTVSNQPVIELKNGAVIENAERGVFAGNPNQPGVYGGGIIYASNATFRNCKAGILFHLYRNFIPGTNIEISNKSFVKKCSFETDDDYQLYSNSSISGITLWGVKGVSIHGNIFKNIIENIEFNPILSYGVVVMGANCNISALCNSSSCDTKIPNTFQNLTRAITIVGSSTLSDVTISENDFFNNQTSIYIDGAHKGLAYKNNINVSGSTFGIYANQCDNFKIEENIIVAKNRGVGILFTNSNKNNEIYKNRISMMSTGIMAISNPKLQISCNEFSNNNQHILINSDGVHWSLGTQTLPAGNTFYPECINSRSEISVSSMSSPLLYIHANIKEEQPLCHNSGVILSATNSLNTCPSRHENIHIPSEDELLLVKSTIANQEAELQAIVDGGSTDKTVDAIETVQDGEELDLMSDLMLKSPFLSETALIKTATEEEVLPEIVIANVLVSNPQAAKSGKVQTALDNRPEPMPQYLRDVINEGLDLISEKEEKEIAKAETVLEKERILSDLITLYQNDETTDHSAAIEALILAENTLSYDYLAIENYLASEQFEEAQQLFDALPTKYAFTETEQADYDAMSQIVDMHVALNSVNYFELTEAQKAALYILAEDRTTRAGALARGILVLVDRAEFPLPEIVVEENENGNKSTAIEAAPAFAFNVSPNPANDYFVVEYDLATKEIEDAQMRMFNKKGKQVYKQTLTKPAFQLLIQTESFEPGVYVCRLYNNSKQMESKTIVIKPNLMTDTEIINEAETMPGNETLFMVYPNPTTDFVTINTNQTENCVLELYNASGVRVYQSDVVSNTTKINTTNYETGVYYLRLVKEGAILENTKLFVE